MSTPSVRGKTIDAQTRCVHYGTELDIVAIKFRCCGQYYPCYLCHEECAGHPPEQWGLDEYDQRAILCGVCSTELTIAEYRGAEQCPSCSAAFNPRCALHAELYFAVDPIVSGSAIPRVLSIAGTDPTGGAGIQADLKSIAASGGYGMAVVTSLVAQNTTGVRAIHTPPPEFLEQQLRAVSDDVGIDAVKIGMMAGPDTVAVVHEWLERTAPGIVVLDPVLRTSTGGSLGQRTVVDSIRALLPRCDVVTPNLDELAALLGGPRATQWNDALDDAHRLARAHSVAVLVTGGHLDGPSSPDALIDPDGRLGHGELAYQLTSPRVDTRNTHGTGCSLSSGLATNRARLGSWIDALASTKQWVSESLAAADDLQVGHGAGPINHFHTLWTGSR